MPQMQFEEEEEEEEEEEKTQKGKVALLKNASAFLAWQAATEERKGRTYNSV
jgi:hypothetical protein